MVTISRDAVGSACALDLCAKAHQTRDRIELFQKRYGKGLAAVERRVRSSPESFTMWDDYMEWKACAESLRSLEAQIRDVKSGHFRVA
jgi:hypothetical protein